MIDLTSLPSFQPANTGLLMPVTPLGSFGRGAISMLPLGNQAYAGIAGLAQNEPYTQERQELTQEQAQDKDINPGATLAGKAAGVISPIVATGGLAAPESLIGAAGQGALLGGAFGAGNAVDTLANGGSGTQAAKDVGIGAGLGALGGVAGESIGALASKGAGSVGDTGLLQRLKAENISKALGLNPRSLVKISTSGDATPEQAVLKTWNDLKGIGLPDDFVAPTSNINDKYGALDALNSQAGQVIGAQREISGQATVGNFPEGMQAARDLANAAKDYVGIPDGSEDAMKQVAAQIQAAENAGKLDFNQLARIRSAVGSQVQAGTPGAHQIYKILSQNLESAGKRIGDSPGIDKAAYQQAMKTYAITSKLLPLMQRGAAREASGTGGGLSNLLGIGGALMGHPAAAAAPIAHEVQKIAAPEMIHNIMLGGLGVPAVGASLPKAAAQVTASQAPTDVNLQHPAMAPYRAIFEKALNGTQDPAERDKTLAVTDFTMSQRFPGYAEAKQQAAEAAANQEQPQSNTAPQNMAKGGVVEPQDVDNPPAGAEIPVEQKLLNALATVGSGYGLGNMIAAAPSKLADEAGALFPSSGLKNFMDGSKVVDSAGNPQVVYHGTNGDFSEFNNASTENSPAGQTWISSDPDKADTFGGGISGVGKAGKNIKPLYAAMKNPAGLAELKKYGAKGLADRGYDGVMIPNANGTFDGFVLKGSQLKSATGNSGAYDPTNPDITMANGGIIPDSTLEGFENLIKQQEGKGQFEPTATAVQSATVPMEQKPSAPVKPDNSDSDSIFNTQMADQLRAYLLGTKKTSGDEE